MSTQNRTPSQLEDEKHQIAHVEETAPSIYEEKNVPNQGKVDYSGFAQKTDPKEIKLVRKLDLHIMVSATVIRIVKLTCRPRFGPCIGLITLIGMQSLWQSVSVA